jgi:hypothetical protein
MRNSFHMLARRATHKFFRFGKANRRDTSAHRFIYLSIKIQRIYLQKCACACFVVNAAVRFLDQLGGLHLQRFLLHEEHEPRLRDDLSDHPWGPHHPLHHWRSDRQRAQEYLRLVQPASRGDRGENQNKNGGDDLK